MRASLPAFQAPVSVGPPGHNAIRKLVAAGRVDEALAALAPLVDGDPSGEAAFLVGWTHYGATRYALALPAFLKALPAGPGYPNADLLFFLTGRCLQERGDVEGSAAAYEADIALHPESGQGRFRLAQLKLETGQVDACEALAQEALERFTRPRDQAKTHALLADVYEARGDDDSAKQALERCVGLFPHYEAFFRLGMICRLEGDEEGAERYLGLYEEWKKRAGR